MYRIPNAMKACLPLYSTTIYTDFETKNYWPGARMFKVKLTARHSRNQNRKKMDRELRPSFAGIHERKEEPRGTQGKKVATGRSVLY
jgi:hypothetical protein